MKCKRVKEKILTELEKIIQELPQPLIEPIWYPLPDCSTVKELLKKIEKILIRLIEIVIETLKEEGFFDENPLIRVYPRYPDATGVIVYYKGRKVFEKWLNVFELNWNNQQEVADEVLNWYEEIYQQMAPEEYEYYFNNQEWWQR